MIRYQLHHGELIQHPEGQWVHVKEVGVKEWALDPLVPAPRRLSEPCKADLRCYRNDGHTGDHVYPYP